MVWGYSALLLVLGCVVAGLSWVNVRAIANTEMLGEMLNKAGKQRMLTAVSINQAMGGLVSESTLDETFAEMIASHGLLQSEVSQLSHRYPQAESLQEILRVYHDKPQELTKRMAVYQMRLSQLVESGVPVSSDLQDSAMQLISGHDEVVSSLEAFHNWHNARTRSTIIVGNVGFCLSLLAIAFSVLRPLARQLAEAQTATLKQASQDPLTGLANRRAVLEKGEALVRVAQRYDRPTTVLYVDIDHFKRVNDTYGHATGDAVLILIASLLAKNVRHSDIAARLGGEEFMILLAETNSLTGAADFAEELRKKVEASYLDQDGERIAVTISIGISGVRDFESSLEPAMARADSALYLAKQGGRNRVEIHYSSSEGCVTEGHVNDAAPRLAPASQ